MIYARAPYGSERQDNRRLRRHRTGYIAQEYGYGRYGAMDFPQTVGMVASDMEEVAAKSPWTAVMIGVTTGVSVWLVTRLLDRVFGITERK